MSEENKNIPEEEPKVPAQGVEGDTQTEGNAKETEVPIEIEERKEKRTISLRTFICSAVAICLAAVMLTVTVTSVIYQKKLADARLDNSQLGLPFGEQDFDELDVLEYLFKYYSFKELDGEALTEAVMKAYVAATGDEYARYYTAEEYNAFRAELSGDSEGIGVNIIEDTVTVNGYEYKAIKVVNVVPESPAEKAGMKKGDLIVAIGTIEEHTTVSSLGYDAGLAALRGTAGTVAQFVAYREKDSGFEAIPFSITREKIDQAQVMFTSVTDPATGEKIGVVKIIQFYLDTPTQFSNAVDTLKAQGCEKFVFDVRYNPGGALHSITAVLSYLLDEGDTIISVVDNKGKGDTIKVGVVDEYEGEDANCNVTKADIGKYKDLDMVVLCNGDTASAAELFVANFRDHGIGKIVGTTTYGKGSVQSYQSLAYFGINGVLKLTTKMYYPPCGVGYDGIGIGPDVTVQVSDSANGHNIYDIFGNLEIDNQLAEAIKYFN